MALYENKVNLKGYVGKDAQSFATKQQNTFVVLSLATKSGYKDKQTDEWVKSSYGWIRDHITPAAAELFTQVTPSALSYTLPGTHANNVEIIYGNWRVLMPMYLANLQKLMQSDEMYPQK